jgi:hypothetical protein
MAVVKAPALPEKVVEFLSVDQLKAVIGVCDGPLLVDGRDQALILCTPTPVPGSRRSRWRLANLDLRSRLLLITGEGNRERVLPFGRGPPVRSTGTPACAAGRRTPRGPWLWLSGKDGRVMSANGVHQMLLKLEALRRAFPRCTRTCSAPASRTRGCAPEGPGATSWSSRVALTADDHAVCRGDTGGEGAVGLQGPLADGQPVALHAQPCGHRGPADTEISGTYSSPDPYSPGPRRP